MCLKNQLEAVKELKAFKTNKGYKYFDNVPRHRREVTGVFYGGHYKLGQWYRAEETQIYDQSSRPYNTGFHIFLRKPSRTKSHPLGDDLYLVEWVDVITQGMDNNTYEGIPAVVTRWVKIVSKVKGHGRR